MRERERERERDRERERERQRDRQRERDFLHTLFVCVSYTQSVHVFFARETHTRRARTHTYARTHISSLTHSLSYLYLCVHAACDEVRVCTCERERVRKNREARGQMSG